ncbi:Chloroperoxidase [Chaetomium strumarium]|uniref:Chloroperoxidase n=1 Tax=Chaetomium strumarium TaxID=1170767 RepID=A0AAJ0M4Y6_9PEZI|nr:Chloroperoxidase [Chaetomium strumarium]
MKAASVLSLAVFAAGAYGTPSSDLFEQWEKPGASDVRGPCPFLNTFANHGFLPRSGKYITEKDLTNALSNAVNIEASAAQFLFDFAVGTNPEPNATWFSLDHLTRHNVLEHDASLSRVDNYFGHADVFNDKAFAETRSYWGDVVDVQTGTAAIVGRIKTCNATNPQFSLSELGFDFILGETVAFISILGDAEKFTVDTRRVEYLFSEYYLNCPAPSPLLGDNTTNLSMGGWMTYIFFPLSLSPSSENERLPTELGWKRPDAPFGETKLFEGIQLLRAEYLKRTGTNSTIVPPPAKRSLRYLGRVSRGGARVF